MYEVARTMLVEKYAANRYRQATVAVVSRMSRLVLDSDEEQPVAMPGVQACTGERRSTRDSESWASWVG